MRLLCLGIRVLRSGQDARDTDANEMMPPNATMLARTAGRRATTAVGPRLEQLLPSWRQRLLRGLTVFIFHEITPTPSAFQLMSGAYTSPAVFAEQLAWIADRFTIVDPVALPQFGGSRELPSNAALLTFDDAWAGVFRVGLPMLNERGFGALLFLNMATVEGEPDLGAVRIYERSMPPDERTLPEAIFDTDTATRVLDQVRARYGSDPEFRGYQGRTAGPDDLAGAVETGRAWFGSHLYHHWDIGSIVTGVYERELLKNAEALASYPNTLDAFATPHGYAGGGMTEPFEMPMKHGVKAIFTGTGNQNREAESPVLDRVFFPPESATQHEWWYATHRRRAIGPRTS